MAKSAKANEKSARDAIVSAYMELLADHAPRQIGLADIAEKAGVGLAALRAEFGSSFDILAAFMKSVDVKVLDGVDADLADQSTRERLFDILMRRLDVLAPHKAAIRSLGEAARRDPGLAMGLNRLAVRSHQFMLAAAGDTRGGPASGLRAQALAALFARVIHSWLDDEDPALARTMRVLDEELGKAERGAKMLADFERVCQPFNEVMASFCRGARTWNRDRWKDRESGGQRWRGDDFRDPNVTPA